MSNVDLRGGDNYSAYHAPDGLWQMIPWDLDMMYIPETHQSGSTPYTTYASNARRVAEIALEVRNRSRTSCWTCCSAMVRRPAGRWDRWSRNSPAW